METGQVWRLGHRPALDGLRGIAVLLVVACHATIDQTLALAAFGPAGVTMFFTLSGFLITALLLEEHSRRGSIDLRAFYVRRARRLLPALAAIGAVVGLLALLLGPAYGTPRDLIAVLLYVGNWLPAHGNYLGALNHTWSLAIEEQFYLVWPLVVIAALRWRSERALLAVGCLGIAASALTKVALFHGGAGADRVYFGSDTRADALLIGCCLAVVLRARAEGRARPVAASALVGLIWVASLVTFMPGWPRYLVLPTFVAWVTAVVITCVARGDYRGWLTTRWLRWVGERSYGLYLWHPLAMMLVAGLGLPWLPTLLLGLAASFVATMLSWRYVEQPWRRHRAGVEPTLPLVTTRA